MWNFGTNSTYCRYARQWNYHLCNNDPDAPINAIADYVIVGTVEEVVPKLIKYYKSNSK